MASINYVVQHNKRKHNKKEYIADINIIGSLMNCCIIGGRFIGVFWLQCIGKYIRSTVNILQSTAAQRAVLLVRRGGSVIGYIFKTASSAASPNSSLLPQLPRHASAVVVRDQYSAL